MPVLVSLSVLNRFGCNITWIIVGDTLMQIWKSPYIPVIISKQHSENLVFLNNSILELFSREVFSKSRQIFNLIYRSYVYKHFNIF